MKYCSHCGKELLDEAVICPSCGCSNESATSKSEDRKVLILVVKIFMILSCIGAAVALIPLCWMIPMTLHVFKKLDRGEPIGMGFRICVLLFCNVVAGVVLLCMDMQ